MCGLGVFLIADKYLNLNWLSCQIAFSFPRLDSSYRVKMKRREHAFGVPSIVPWSFETRVLLNNHGVLHVGLLVWPKVFIL